MIVNQDLEFFVPNIQKLRKLIPKQCKLKGDVNIGLLSNRYVLIRASRMEDYLNLLSKLVFYIAHCNLKYRMRKLKQDPLFYPQEETTIAIAWISLSSLPPIFLEKEKIFSIAYTVGKPLQVDMEISNKIRPNFARVKVEVNRLGDFCKRVNVGIRRKS